MKILILQLRRLGDLILTSPALASIRVDLPTAKIVLAIEPDCEPLLPLLPGSPETIVIHRGLRDLKAWLQLRRGCFDWTIDLTRSDRSAWLTWLAASPNRVVSSRLKRKSKLRARLYNSFVDCAMKDMHTIDYYQQLLQPLGITASSGEISLQLPESARAAAAAIIAGQIGGRQFALFHPGSARQEKFWEPDRWAEVIHFATRQLDLHPVLSGGKGAREQSHLAAIRQRLQVPVTDLSGEVDLLTVAALLEQARALVSVDSVPVHLASAFKTPQVVLFGPTNPFHWRPRNSPAAVLFGNSTKPVTTFDRDEPRRPMNQISTTAVIDAIRSMLSAPTASAV